MTAPDPTPEPDPTSDVPGMGIWGWTHPPELRWLREQAQTMESVVEVGSLHGRSAFALLTGCPGLVYCIDPWNDEHDRALPSFLSNVGHFENLRAIQGLSPQVTEQIPDVDMTFIDGAHDYEQVVRDIEGWLPKTRVLICGHDYTHLGYPGVRKAVDERLGGQVVNPPETSIWAVWLDGRDGE